MVDCTIDLTQDASYNLVINKNRDLDQEIQAEIYSGTTFVSNFSFTGYTGATLNVKVKPQDNYSVLTFSTADGSIVLGANGVFKLVKTALELQNIKGGSFYYNMFLSSTLQPKRAFLSGQFIIIQNVG
jgi:hypothetical protein